MSFGVGTGDIILLTQLAWSAYRSCKEAPSHFQVLTGEVMRLHIVLKETDEALNHIKLSAEQHESLASLANGCEDVLKELEALIDKFQGLGSQSRRTFDRLKWAQDDVRQLRERLVSCVSMLMAFNTTISMVSQARLEKLLKQFLEEYRTGRREGSVIASVAGSEVGIEDEETWRQLADELRDSGVPVSMQLKRKDDIVAWFVNAEKTGGFEKALPTLEPSDEGRSTAERPQPVDATPAVGNGTHSTPAITTTTTPGRPAAPSHSRSDSSLFAKLRQKLPSATKWKQERRSQSPLPLALPPPPPLPPSAKPTLLQLPPPPAEPSRTGIMIIPNSSKLPGNRGQKADPSPGDSSMAMPPPPPTYDSVPPSPVESIITNGNFHLKATNIRLKRGHFLSALLENDYGEMMPDDFDLDEILGNHNGNFYWGDHNFSHSARGIRLNLDDLEDQGPMLEAELRSLDGTRWDKAVLYLSDYLANKDGRFVVVSRWRKRH